MRPPRSRAVCVFLDVLWLQSEITISFLRRGTENLDSLLGGAVEAILAQGITGRGNKGWWRLVLKQTNGRRSRNSPDEPVLAEGLVVGEPVVIPYERPDPMRVRVQPATAASVTVWCDLRLSSEGIALVDARLGRSWGNRLIACGEDCQ